MPAPIPVPIRQALWHRLQRGALAAELARDFDLNPRTVRGLLRRFRDRGAEAIAPDPTRPSPRPSHPAREAALRMRRDHPGWGAGLIRVQLLEAGVGERPSERTLQRWFRAANLSPAPPGRRPVGASGRATRVHETWQVDAADRIPLAGATACWLRIVDECSGAVLATAVSPPRPLGCRAAGLDPRAAPPGLHAVGPAAAHPRR